VVAATGGGTTAWSGAYLAEDIQLLKQGVDSGSWVDLTLGGVGTGLDTLGLITDPLGTLATWGVAWLLEHVKPLKEALDKLAGDPGQISANAATWRNASSQLTLAAGDYGGAVTGQLRSWGGPASDAYRASVAEHQGAMSALAEASATMASIIEGSGMLVALVRTMVRDAIAEFVSVLAVRLWEWLAEEAGTLGIGTPWVIAQVSALVGKWVEKITKFFRGLLNSLRSLRTVVAKLMNLIENVLRKVCLHSRVGLNKLSGHYNASEDLIGAERLKHILTGDGGFRKWWDGTPGGGHLWPGLKGKTPFPEHWNVDDIKRYVSDIATDPNAITKDMPKDGRLFSASGKPLRWRLYGTRDGVQIRVVIEPGGEGIITAFPWPGAPT
jgi:uncharacterized protein YukE